LQRISSIYDDGSFSQQIDSVITNTNVAPLYMRVRREGDHWTQSYSFDGQNWATSGSFQHALTVSTVGSFVGNSGSNPAHTALIDYFFNTASRIVPEDGDRNTLTVNVVGNGTVTEDPGWVAYNCGDVVTLTATPALGWNFGGWSGDLTGSANPASLTMTGGRVVTASFVNRPPPERIFLPLITHSRQVSSLYDARSIFKTATVPRWGAMHGISEQPGSQTGVGRSRDTLDLSLRPLTLANSLRVRPPAEACLLASTKRRNS
jgi:hypothetical protein